MERYEGILTPNASHFSRPPISQADGDFVRALQFRASVTVEQRKYFIGCLERFLSQPDDGYLNYCMSFLTKKSEMAYETRRNELLEEQTALLQNSL